MLKVYFNPKVTDAERRKLLYEGAILFCSATQESLALCEHAREMTRKTFGAVDPEYAQENLLVEEFVGLVGSLKSRFTNDPETKQLVRAYLLAMGVSRETAYFDVPGFRIGPHSDYLTAGVSYAYKAHRDTWYSGPLQQVNWWMPIWDVTTERTMGFYPKYFNSECKNNSEVFDYDEWKRVGRPAAKNQIKQDTRVHPLPLEELNEADEFRYSANVGEAIVFSGTHVHATRPNTSDRMRFSMDFRSIDLDDVRHGRGPRNVDARARGTTLTDYLKVDDLSPIKLDGVREVA